MEKSHVLVMIKGFSLEEKLLLLDKQLALHHWLLSSFDRSRPKKLIRDVVLKLIDEQFFVYEVVRDEIS